MTDFEQLGAQIAREQDALLAKRNVQAEVRSRIAELDVSDLRRSAQAAATRRAALIWAGGGVALAAAAVALVSLRGLNVEPETLSAHLVEEQTRVAVGQYVQAPQEAELGLAFSDGSHIQVTKSSRARLAALRSNGADVSLESGLMHVQVKHRDDTSWHIGAGPFGVHVIGTRFDVRWKPEDDSFELTLHEGKVELSGCVFGAGYRMLAGQTVRASCKNDSYQVRPTSPTSTKTAAAGSGSVERLDGHDHLDHLDHHDDLDNLDNLERAAEASQQAEATTSRDAHPSSTESRTAPHTEQPAGATRAPRAEAAKAAETKPSRPQAAQAPRVDKPARAADWRPLARAGQYAQALRTVRASGFQQECAQANMGDLTLLAYTARHGQDAESEAYAWRLLRERFRGTKDASVAAFALGRIEFDKHGAYAKAAEWFRTYLREQPQGDLSREALGRLLEATQHLGDVQAARKLAARYLAEYPQGPHAGLARRLDTAAASKLEQSSQPHDSSAR